MHGRHESVKNPTRRSCLSKGVHISAGMLVLRRIQKSKRLEFAPRKEAFGHGRNNSRPAFSKTFSRRHCLVQELREVLR